MACKKITISIPEETVEYLNYLSDRLRVTRSSLITEMMSEPIRDLAVLVSSVPDNPTREDLLHAKGQSIQLVEERINAARRLGDDLFSK